MVNDLTVTKEQEWWSNTQLAALQHMGVQDAPNADLAVFLHQCKRTGLDPFSRQVYMIGRKNKVKQWQNGQQVDVWETKWTIQTAIDGFRLIARRAADHNREKFAEPETLWCGEDGVWHDVWLGESHPTAAKVVVERGDGVFTAVALFNEYCGTRYDKTLHRQVPNSMWASKPAVMLAKCAEALALRKAFPQDLSGLYTADEMNAAEDIQATVVEEPEKTEPEKSQWPEPETVEAGIVEESDGEKNRKALLAGLHDVKEQWLSMFSSASKTDFNNELRRIVGRQDVAPQNITLTECETAMQAFKAQIIKQRNKTNNGQQADEKKEAPSEQAD